MLYFIYMIENQTIKERLILFIKSLSIGQGKFEAKCGLSNGYVNNIKRSIQPDKLQKISLQYPSLNTGWLMTGEGEMLKTCQSVGDISNSNVSGVNVKGSGININPNAYDALLKIVEANQKVTEKFQEQIDRLISIIEKRDESANR